MKNYSLSGWIENLGVVPLFLFAAFLFLPIFLSFNLLLHCVCIVLDAIILSLFINLFSCFKSRQIFLYVLLFIVKGFYGYNATCKEPSDKSNIVPQHFISRGEQQELKINKLDNYSIGNSDILSVKVRPDKKTILIKAKSMGFSDLILWQNGKKITHNFYVISKKEQLKRAEILKGLSSMGLKSKVFSKLISVEGEINNLNDYKSIIKIQQLYPKILWNVQLSQQVRNQIIADIYKHLYIKDENFIQCNSLLLTINCNYQGILNEHFKSILSNSYHIKFISTERVDNNFLVEFKVIQLENYNTTNNDLGIDEISTTVEKLLNYNQFLSQQSIAIVNKSLQAKLMAAPKTLVTLNQPFEVSLGSEIPFSQTNNNATNTNWKFAGLKISGQILKDKKWNLLKYETSFTGATDQVINGTKGKGIAYIKGQKFVRIFEITSVSNKEDTQSLSFLKHIPIINNFFRNTTKTFGNKQIIGFARIRRK